MVIELLVPVSTLTLMFHCFRRNCRAILRRSSRFDGARHVAQANNLGFLDITGDLRAAADLDRIHDSLNREYGVLMSLLRYTAKTKSALTVEQRWLMLDFKLMGAWYTVTRRHAHAQARSSLDERSRILRHFGNEISRRTGPSRQHF
jgi:hypothetical protein